MKVNNDTLMNVTEYLTVKICQLLKISDLF